MARRPPRLIGTVLLGMGSGAEHDIAAFMISRYFGIKAFGATPGFMFVFTGFVSALGGILLGWCFQLTHSYNAGLVIFEVLFTVSIVLNVTLGPNRFRSQAGIAPRARENGRCALSRITTCRQQPTLKGGDSEKSSAAAPATGLLAN